MYKPCWLLVCFGASILTLIDGQLLNSTIVESTLDSNETLDLEEDVYYIIGGEPTYYGEFPFVFRENFRINRGTSQTLIQKYEASSYFKRKIDCGGRKEIPAEVQILAFLWFTGNKDSYREVANLFNLAISTTYNILTRVVEFIFEISPNYIKFPSTDEEKYHTAAKFQQAALGWTSDSGELSFHGGGMVISPKMILTAAHCVYRDGKIPDVVYVGGGNLSEALSNELADRLSLFSKFSVVNVTIFPQYNSRQAYHDIAILELDESIWFPPICLWNCDKLYTNNVSAIGYGLTEFAGMGSQQLLKVNLTIFPSDYCEPFFKRQRKFKLGLSKDHICAGDKDGKRDTCQGDSGGPLVIYHNNKMYAVGITSSGQACSGFPPAIYTKIQSYIKWITEIVEDRGEYLKQCDVCE